MECTQRLECTQELYETHSDRVCPEQIGFVGILGAKHPVLKGPNKIGRDPQTCNIVLNLNSVSRQHAVINVLNSREFMLMDLDSANKTKLLNKTLQPYIPHPLRNGDTVQFGDIFGIFRLLEEDDELPMTQAIDVPETPVPSKHMSKLHKAPTTLIPESPDVSDRDDSFITPSQPQKVEKSKLSNSQTIKPFGKTISIQPVSSPKTDNNRDSSKRSTSISFIENPNTSLNESFVSLNSNKNVIDNIHEMDTQAPNPIANDSTDSIYTADTQIPLERACSPSIHSVNTQLPSPSIHSLNTQLPVPATEHLPQVRKIDDQHEMQFNIYAANKENDISIFNAETQPLGYYDKNGSTESIKSLQNKSNLKEKTIFDGSPKAASKENLNTSEEELLFDEIDGECFEEDFNSQKILPDELPLKEDAEENIESVESNYNPSKRNARIPSDGSTDCEDIDMLPTQKILELPTVENTGQENIKVNNVLKAAQRSIRIKSDSSTDCEDDITPTKKIPEIPSKELNKKENVDEKLNTAPVKRVNRIQSDSSTDCEDIDLIPTQKIPENRVNEDDDETDCEDDVIEIKTNKPNKPHTNVDVTKFEDMPTQVIYIDCETDKTAFEDMPTQIIDVDKIATSVKNVPFEDQPTQIIDEIVPKTSECAIKSVVDITSPFKIPLQSPIRIKRKDIPKLTSKHKTTAENKSDDHYYNATQDIYDDLCSQRETSPEIFKNVSTADDIVVPCSVEDYKVGEKFANIDLELSPTKRYDDEKVTNFVTNLSSQQVRDVIGVEVQVAKLKKGPSDSSDVESTPKKRRPLLFTDSDLPNSQEIKTNVGSNIRSTVTESSSESETENCSEDQFTPFIHRKKKTKPDAKIDLTKKFDIEKLPERVITRQRKPTYKLLDSNEIDKKLSSSILRPTYLIEQEDQIDEDIITENIKRLKTFEKAKTNKDSNKESNESVKVKNESTSQKKTEHKNKEPKEKIRVKIEKPKRKETVKESKSDRETSARKSDGRDKDKSKEVILDSTSSSAKSSSRRTRGKKKESDSNPTESKSVSPENKKEPENKRKRTNKRQEKSKSPEVEIRRSKRQQKAKEKSVDNETIQAPRSILKKSIHEQSTVYNVSSSSGGSPRSLKRSLVDDSDVPSPKRTRSFVNNTNSISINNTSLRATPARVMKTQHVLFTAFPSEEVKQKLEKLGAVIVTDVLECSVVLTMQVKRTFKLLCAVGLGRPIVGPSWVQACVDTHMIVDPWLYLVKDEPAEKRFQFNLERTLTSKRNFLKGYNVSSTPSVQPNASEMKLIVECSGGTWKEGGSNWMCVSSTKDKALWPSLRKRGAIVVSTEFILGGVLRQKLDITSNMFP